MSTIVNDNQNSESPALVISERSVVTTRSQRRAATEGWSEAGCFKPSDSSHWRRPCRPVWFRRACGVAFGVGTQLGFLVTVWFLFFYLKDGSDAGSKPWILVDTLLALQFSLIHSSLLHPTVKRRLTKYIPSEFYGCLFCVATCLNLAVIFVGWRGSEGTLWDLTGVPATVMQGCFYVTWIALFYSLYLSGLGYQTGLTPWWHWLRRQPQPRRQFEQRSLYRWFRHPIYLSFLGLIWFTPRMSWDHALLTGIWTVYIFVGSYLKDERLAYYMGNEYRSYQERIVGYPLVFFGPLGRRRPVASSTTNRVS